MAGKTLQVFADIVSELRAGRPVHFVGHCEAAVNGMRYRVGAVVDPEDMQRFTTSVAAEPARTVGERAKGVGE